MTSRVRFCVLGPIRAWRDDRKLDLGSPQQQATLAVLVLHEGRLTLAQDLITAIWGEDSPRAAAGTIRTYISRLRRVLNSDDPHSAIRIESIGGGYALRFPADALDLATFRQLRTRARTARQQSDPATAAAALREATNLWTGVPLSGLAGPYVQAQRASLEQELLTAHEDRLAVELELGHHTEVGPELIGLAAQHPLREQFHELLMLALYRSGRQAEALGAFTHVRHRLAEELGVDPGPRLQRLRRRILEGDPDLELLPPHAPVARVPQQLPADRPDFTGRATVLTQITDALVAGDVPLVAIAGAGGLGKTAVAVHAAHRVRAHFPDGQVFIALDGLEAAPADPGEVLGVALRAFDVPEDLLPATLGERAALWRTVLAHRRVLIVLDDAADDAQVRPLLPSSAGSAVIVTGRRWLPDLPSTHRTTLDGFDPDEAVTLLARLAGPDRVAAEPDDARLLAAVCSNLPHAVRLAGHRLRARPHWTIAEVTQRLVADLAQAAGPGDLSAVHAPFRRGYERLNEPAARAFRLLAVLDVDSLSTDVAAAVLKVPDDVAEAVLESLADVHLIEAGRRGHYCYRTLVRVFARHLAYTQDGTATCRSALRRASALPRGTRVPPLFSQSSRQHAAPCPDHATAV